MKKKISIITLILIILFFICACTFSSYATIDQIGNFMDGTKNMMENAASSTGNMIKNGTNSMSNSVDNFVGRNV